MRQALIPSFAAAAAALTLGFSGSAASARPASPDAGPLCSGVMRLEPGQAQFDACAASLADSLGRLQAARGITAAREACVAQGLKAGAPDLALCALNGARAQPAPAAVTLASAPAAGGKSYFQASWRERHGREQEACARLGLDPTSSAFDGCVAGLASALFAADNPSN